MDQNKILFANEMKKYENEKKFLRNAIFPIWTVCETDYLGGNHGITEALLETIHNKNTLLTPRNRKCSRTTTQDKQGNIIRNFGKLRLVSVR